MFGACFEQQLLLSMSAPPPMADRRPVSMVAIIGNDTVLDAAPATPVQLAHACLRRGFTVAVPVSWGDELIATETVRRLASRERGPAVMCVCPFARSRLLAPGPDLARFLVSLVAPPVATARYLRAAYGEHGVHITYIGGCPSADDPSIDECLTPDTFLADLAGHGIALAEQPLVFDSIVPPDRRRWCSLPGGTPTADVLWGDSDMRTLIEIDRDDVSTDLAQHIITHEHVLLDLAPGLGCVCSGAIRSSRARTARAAVTAVEPPRSPKPVIDPAPIVSLDAPVAEHITPVLTAVAPAAASVEGSLESRLDELLGSPIERPWTASEPELELAVDFTVEATIRTSASADFMEATSAPVPQESAESASTGAGLAETASTDAAPPTVPEPEVPSPVASTPDTSAQAPAPTTSLTHETAAAPVGASADPNVRRHAPPFMPVRYPTSSIPRATASDGKALPRAYVAKRRTPSGGVPPVDETPRAEESGAATREGQNGSAALALVTPPATTTDPTPAADNATPADQSAGREPSLAAETSGVVAEQPPMDVPDARSETSTAETAAPETSPSEPLGGAPDSDESSRSDSNATGGAAIATDTSAGPIVALLIALLAIGFFVLRALK